MARDAHVVATYNQAYVSGSSSVDPEIHPATAKGAKRPDFLGRCPGHGQGFVEAVAVTPGVGADHGAQRRLHDLYQALQETESPEFFLTLRVHGVPHRQPPVRRLVKALNEWVAKLDVEGVTARLKDRGISATPRWVYSGEGYRIEVHPAMRKSPKNRGKPGLRNIGMRMEGGELAGTAASVRQAIVKKAGRYGNLSAPYVVTVNVLSEYFERTDMIEALFGDEQVIVRQGADGRTKATAVLAPNGVWTSRGGPRYTRLSAVLAVERLNAWNVARTSVRVFHNPRSEHPYDCELNRFPQVKVVGGRLVDIPGITLAEALGLPPDWPGED